MGCTAPPYLRGGGADGKLDSRGAAGVRLVLDVGDPEAVSVPGDDHRVVGLLESVDHPGGRVRRRSIAEQAASWNLLLLSFVID